jgi:hypothetical protein
MPSSGAFLFAAQIAGFSGPLFSIFLWLSPTERQLARNLIAERRYPRLAWAVTVSTVLFGSGMGLVTLLLAWLGLVRI